MRTPTIGSCETGYDLQMLRSSPFLRSVQIPTLAGLALAALWLAALWLAPAAFAEAPATPVCDYTPDVPETLEEIAEAEERALERARLATYYAQLPAEPDAALLMPVAGVRVAQVADTWGGPRDGGRSHEGQDIFAPRGTPVYSATHGIIYRIETRDRGGRVVWVAGAGGRRYYYAHLDDWADVHEGLEVSPDTVLGYVGNTGNAITTPPHLHLGIYSGSRSMCDRAVHDPLPLLVDR